MVKNILDGVYGYLVDGAIGDALVALISER